LTNDEFLLKIAVAILSKFTHMTGGAMAQKTAKIDEKKKEGITKICQKLF